VAAILCGRISSNRPSNHKSHKFVKALYGATENLLILSSALHKTLKMQHLGINIQPIPPAQKSVNTERRKK